jgi:hypothetical protein
MTPKSSKFKHFFNKKDTKIPIFTKKQSEKSKKSIEKARKIKNFITKIAKRQKKRVQNVILIPKSFKTTIKIDIFWKKRSLNFRQ